jgi:hypothetical protein
MTKYGFLNIHMDGNPRSLPPPNPRGSSDSGSGRSSGGSSDSQSGSGSGSSSDSVGKSSDNSCGHLAIVQCYVYGITVNLILQSGSHLAYSNCRPIFLGGLKTFPFLYRFCAAPLADVTTFCFCCD